MGRRKRESPLEVAMQWIAKKNDSPGFQIDRFKDKGMLIVKPSPSQAPPNKVLGIYRNCLQVCLSVHLSVWKLVLLKITVQLNSVNVCTMIGNYI